MIELKKIKFVETFSYIFFCHHEGISLVKGESFFPLGKYP